VVEPHLNRGGGKEFHGRIFGFDRGEIWPLLRCSKTVLIVTSAQADIQLQH
jgi:hypothetical protein